MHKENKNIDPRNLSIFKKGKEIFDVVHKICELMPEDKKQFSYILRDDANGG